MTKNIEKILPDMLTNSKMESYEQEGAFFNALEDLTNLPEQEFTNAMFPSLLQILDGSSGRPDGMGELISAIYDRYHLRDNPRSFYELLKNNLSSIQPKANEFYKAIILENLYAPQYRNIFIEVFSNLPTEEAHRMHLLLVEGLKYEKDIDVEVKLFINTLERIY